jgi:Domain of Unknown Function (DUF928)
MKLHHSFYLSLVVLLSASIGFPPLPQRAIASSLCNPQQSNGYQACMDSGYRAAAKRDFKTALENFNRALQLRPGDPTATLAVKNIKTQLQRGPSLHVTPSGIGAPSDRARAGTRQQNCLDGKKVVALIPENELGFTSQARPTVIFFIPKTSAKTLQIVLENPGNAKPIYSRTLNAKAKAGFVQLKFSEFSDAPSLTLNKTYQWKLTLLCDTQDPSANVTVYGNIQRINLDPILVNHLKDASVRDRATLYAINGLWYDTLATLADTLQSNPNHPELVKDWNEILKSEGLDAEL